MRRASRKVRRDYGDGGPEGIVLSLALSSEDPYDSVYTVNAKIGGQVLPLQVDTGSADLWVASTSCQSSSCSGAGLYDPSVSSVPTNKSFSIQYLRGKVSGPIVWDDVSIGSYDITTQALAAANVVQSESLVTDYFSGILGLAPALDSVIAQWIPPVTNNDPDGAPWTSNLYSNGASAPEHPFFSLLLERPDDPDTVSVLGLGMHPVGIPSFNTTKLSWNPVVTSSDGALFWRVPVDAITISVNGQSVNLTLPVQSATVPTSTKPVAVLDSGGPTILAGPAITDAFYGAFGVNPAADGNFYPLCTLMMNASITIGNVVYPIHPLDLSIPSSSDPTSPNCVGGLQTVTGITEGDIILGAAFLRNVYSVYTSSSSVYWNGSMPPPPPMPYEGDLPHVGLFPLTNPTSAAQDFHTIRVLEQPITPTASPMPSGGSGQAGSSSSNSQSGSSSGASSKIPLGVTIMLGVIGGFILIGLLFVIWGCLKRRRRSNQPVDPSTSAIEKALRGDGIDFLMYKKARRTPSGLEDIKLRTIQFEAMKKEGFRSISDGVGTTTTMTGGTGTGTEWGGSDPGTPWAELGVGECMHGRYPSPVRNSRAESVPRPEPVEGEEDRPPPTTTTEDQPNPNPNPRRSSTQPPLLTFAAPPVRPRRSNNELAAAADAGMLHPLAAEQLARRSSVVEPAADDAPTAGSSAEPSTVKSLPAPSDVEPRDR